MPEVRHLTFYKATGQICCNIASNNMITSTLNYNLLGRTWFGYGASIPVILGHIKTINGVAWEHIKSYNGVDKSHIKTALGVEG